MKIHFTGRQIEITPSLRKAAEERLGKLEKFLEPVREAHVILVVEKRRHRAEVVVHGKHVTLSAAGVTADMYSSLALVAERLERQAKKHREKLKVEKKRQGARSSLRRILTPVESGSEGPQVVRVDASPLKPMSVEEAVLQVTGTEREFLVFRNASSRRVSVLYRRKDGNFGLIEPEA
ncbi:MAG: ribosome-associated translation inhibitor RaiA [Acidobacteria bacterium]|nr:MAG: ribosome-associated translation inhibitor RaiA [Acidobacteriota bacterium]